MATFMPPWPEWQFEYIGTRFLGKLLGLWSAFWVNLLKKLFRSVRKAVKLHIPQLQSERSLRGRPFVRVFICQEALQNGELNAAHARTMENSHSESCMVDG